MNKLWIISLICLAFVASVHGLTQTFSDTNNALTDWSDTFTVSKFDTTLGTLTSVQITIGVSITTEITVTHTGPAETTSTGTARTEFGVNFDTAGGNNPFSVASNILGTDVETDTLTNALAYSITGPGSQVLNPPTKSDTAAADITVTSGAFFTEVQASGGGTLSLPVNTKTVTSLTNSGGNTDANQVTTASATVTIIYTYTAAVAGDPQIVGFQGQRYQIHGIPDEHFALISTPSYYVNGRFVYIANGVCNYNDTECFSHPGTYIDQIGVVSESSRLRVVAGSHEHGLKAYLNDEALPVGVTNKLSSNVIVRVLSNSRVRVIFPDTTITIVNSDHFFNLGADFTDVRLYEAGHKLITVADKDAKQAAITLAKSYPEYNMHGLLGQTWRNIVWPHQRLYEGEPTDYQTNGLFGSEFVYSQYIQPTQSKAQ